MALIRIVRDSGYADYFRSYKIVLDGKAISTIRNGETKHLSVLPGQHELSLRIAWCGSKAVQFSAIEGETAVFLVKSSLRGVSIALTLWYVLFSRNSYLQLDWVGNESARPDETDSQSRVFAGAPPPIPPAPLE